MFIDSTVLPLLLDTVSCVIKFSRQSLWLTIFFNNKSKTDSMYLWEGYYY